ncbi:DUF5825 family protein [Streptomyces sp. NPDC089919]|uniref:DUF5825 family protein n=1 Tax=Streptomyces sp. NPDC089919 TaxID=3155188 RepID=UPI0034172429
MGVSALMDIAELRERGTAQAPAPAGGRPGSTTLTLGAEWEALPAPAELAALLGRVPVAGVRLARTVDLSALPDEVIVRVVALLRECASIGARVSWALTLGADRLGLVGRLDHLPAPERVTVQQPCRAPAAGWRSADSFGLLYFRRGPGFLSVVDQRPESAGETILADPTVIEVFLQGLAGPAWTELTADPERAAAARGLVESGLLLRVGGHAVTLPVHMREWPLGAALLGGTLAAAGKKKDEAGE